MRKMLPMLLLVIFLTTASIQGQRSASEVAQTDDPKPCVVVVGAVRAPARIEIRRQVRLHEVLAIAGGLTTQAGETIQLVHTGSKCFQSSRVPAANSASSSGESTVLNISDIGPGEEKADPYIVAGDLVIVSVQEPIYVVGSVVNPRAIYSKERVTLTQAIRLAGGVTSNSNTSKVVIYRPKKGLTGVSITVDCVSITVDYWAIRKHSAEDPTLQPFDIIYVGAGLMPGFSHSIFDTRPLIPKEYRVIY
jgi:polysaccharide export outer membrane protein